MNAITAAANPLSTLNDRFILTQVKSLTLVIPALWVAEIFQIERSQILPLPFYGPLLAGITHQGGRVLPLLSAHHLLDAGSSLLSETIMVVKLGDAAGVLAQVGVVVDRTLGSQTRADLPESVFTASPQAVRHPSMVLLRPDHVNPEVWQPQCWIPSSHTSSGA